MKVVYKYPVEWADTFKLSLPYHAQILHAGVQNEMLCIWALVDPASPLTEAVKFHIVGTGHKRSDIDYDTTVFIGTVFHGPLVFHIFKETT